MKTIQITARIFKSISQFIFLCAISPLLPAIGLMWLFAWLEPGDAVTTNSRESKNEQISKRSLKSSHQRQWTADDSASLNLDFGTSLSN